MEPGAGASSGAESRAASGVEPPVARGVEPRRSGSSALVFGVTLVALVAASIWIQIERDRRYERARTGSAVLYVPAGSVLERLALSYDALLADVYWVRAIQHYGGTKLSKDEGKQYDLLYPLLDITTGLDPRFNVAYRFGAIFLTEAYPSGPGRPDQAVALLKKGIRNMPERWQYVMDIGFIYYWWLHDYPAAAGWFLKGSQVQGAPWWLEPLAAATLAQGGHRGASRLLWQQIYEAADNDWMKGDAARRLAQLDALDQIDQLAAIVRAYHQRAGRWPGSWRELVTAGSLRGEPRDPAGAPYALDPATGRVDVVPESRLFPLPAEPPAGPPPPP